MMNDAPLTYIIPGWWPVVATLFLLVALVCGWQFIRHPHPLFSRRLRAGLWMLRMVVGLFLLACTLDWRREISSEDPEKPMLQVLVDRSASMAVADASGGRSRFEEAKARLRDRIIPVWNDARRLEIASVGDGFRVENPLMAAPDAPSSFLGTSLRDALKDGGGKIREAVILISDGAAEDPEELRDAARLYRTARIPIYPWVVGTNRQPPDVRIVSASLRQPNPSHTMVLLEATVESPGCADIVTELTVAFDGQILHRQSLTLNGGSQNIDASFISPYLGFHFYDIDVQPVPEERVQDNNRTRAACDLRRDPIRVIYMEGSAPSEIDFLKDGLEADPDLSVVSLHFPGIGSLESLAREAREVRGKDTRIFYDRKRRQVPSVCHPTRGFPNTLPELLEYDVIIDSDIIKEAFSPEQMQNMVEFVEQFGGGFVMVGGMTSFGAGNYETTVIDKLMPVEITNQSDPMSFHFQVKLTEAGMRHPIMNVGESPAETHAAWTSRFPGFDGANYASRAKPGAHVLARIDSPDAPAKDLILFAVQNIGRGRTMAFMSDTTEGWGTRFERSWGGNGPHAKYYRKFWNNTIRWLAADRIARKGGQALVEIATSTIIPGDTVPVRITALATTELPDLAVAVRTGNEAPQPIPIRRENGTRSWEGSFVPKATGDFVIEASYKNAEGAPVITRSGVHVRVSGNESIAVAARPDLMEELARETGGTVLGEENVRQVLNELAARAAPVVWKRPVAIWDQWWVLGSVLCLIALEWLLRRKTKPTRSVNPGAA